MWSLFFVYKCDLKYGKKWSIPWKNEKYRYNINVGQSCLWNKCLLGSRSKQNVKRDRCSLFFLWQFFLLFIKTHIYYRNKFKNKRFLIMTYGKIILLTIFALVAIIHVYSFFVCFRADADNIAYTQKKAVIIFVFCIIGIVVTLIL